MKKLSFLLSAAIAVAVMVSGCNPLTKMVKKAGDVKYKTTPCPLEMHANKVPIDVNVTFPPKYFGKKVKLVITPALVADDNTTKEHPFKTQTVIGESFQDNYKTISYKEGGTFSFQDTIEYEADYRTSDLELRFQISTQKGKTADITKLKLCDGIITTPELVDKGVLVDTDGASTMGKMINIPITKPAVSTETQGAKIFFDMQKSNVKKGELKKEEIKNMKSSIVEAFKDPNKELKNVKFASYASPDGPMDMNAKLVKERGQNSQKAIEKMFSKSEKEKMGNPELFIAETTPDEDWDGFQKMVQASDMEDKELVLRVLSMYSDPDTREAEIKKLAAVYDKLREDILPMLRRSEIKFEFQSKARSDQELLAAVASTEESQNLPQEEFLYAASIADKSNKENLYVAYTTKYPEDLKAWNNLACEQAAKGNLTQAKTTFEKVLSTESNNAAALNNMGVIELTEGNLDAAWDYFERAENAGCQSPNLGYNKGIILIKRAKYGEAVGQFNEDSFNKALAETLSGNNEGAINTLNNMGEKEQGIFYYLKAVTAAKAENVDGVIKNLKTAISKDSELRAYAEKDIEFRNLVDNTAFRGVFE
ncbi:MAG: hypothetical protein CSB06_02755 [Bacteroidia bacterium]|nr:MAG: hypothetical protein CSB06_02755 [Bacteroidia bacterium]